MLEESLLKTNFLGRDGFRWWVGQIPPLEKSYVDQSNGGGWGNRVKVRILGYHPYNTTDLKNEDLPWAIVMLGATDGSGAGNKATSIKIAPGDTVIGFFLDGDNGQVPVIMGVLGRTSQVPSADFTSPFVPFTGYTDNIKNDGGSLPRNESNEFGNAGSQKHVRSVSPETAKKVNAKVNPENDPAKAEISASKQIIGQKVKLATGDAGAAVAKIKVEVDNFVGRVQEITSGITDAVGNAKQELFKQIDAVTESIQKGAMKIVNDMTKNLTNAMKPMLNTGLQGLYDIVYNITLAATANPVQADIDGTIAQATMIMPVKELSDSLPCIANKVVAGIGDTIKGILQSVADNVTNFVSCIGDQVIGGIMNTIINQVSSFLEPFMKAFSSDIFDILGGFSPMGFLRDSADAILGLADRLGCNETPGEFDLAGDVWTIGKGLGDKVGVPVDDILETANQAQSLADLAINTVQDIAADTGSLGFFDFANPSVGTPGFKSPLGECFAGPPELGGCGGTKVKIFGGGVKGIGGVANAIFQIAEGGRGVTGSLIGVDLVNGGGGYTFPPFVEIVDECKNGYGASASAVIDYDPDSPTYQQITDIILKTEGENYTPSADLQDYIVPKPVIENSGANYTNDDVVTDSNGDTYSIKVDDAGRIYDVIKDAVVDDSGDDTTSIIEFPTITDTLTYTIKSKIGAGAILKPKFVVRPEGYQGTVRQVIDCISKDDNFVGYVNGKKYYGPFHIHMGRKMTGVSHTGSGQYIYDTPAESLGSASRPVTTTTTTTTTATVTSTPTATPSPTPTPTPTPPATSGGGGSAPTPSPTPTPPPSPPTPPPSSGGGYGGGY